MTIHRAENVAQNAHNEDGPAAEMGSVHFVHDFGRVKTLLAELLSAGMVLSIKGDRLAFDAPAGVITNNLLARMKADRDGLLAMLAVVPVDPVADAVPGPVVATSIRCPFCSEIELADDPGGLRCGPCEALAWVATVEGGLARRDVADSVIELVDPDLVSVCPSCGRWCDVITLAGSWRCSQCDPEAKDRRLRTKRFNLLARSALKKKATEDDANAI